MSSDSVLERHRSFGVTTATGNVVQTKREERTAMCRHVPPLRQLSRCVFACRHTVPYAVFFPRYFTPFSSGFFLFRIRVKKRRQSARFRRSGMPVGHRHDPARRVSVGNRRGCHQTRNENKAYIAKGRGVHKMAPTLRWDGLEKKKGPVREPLRSAPINLSGVKL